MSARNALVFAALLLVCAVTSRARAYSDLSRFEDPVGEDPDTGDSGGGGGRFFTGSPADGFTCKVCHLQGKPLEIVVNSLPDRYSPGQIYDVLVGWSEGADHVSAALELTDQDGHGAGEVTLPRGKVLTEQDQCEPYVFGIPAAVRYDLPDGRQVLGLADCGARQIAFQWKAPPVDVGPIWFSGAIVRSNNESDIDDDGVTEFRRAIPSEGSTVVQSTAGGCSVPRGWRGGSPWGWLVVVAALRFARSFTRSSRRRRA